MRGYKIFGSNYTCREYKYSLDTPNIYDGKIEVCGSGFHFCPVVVDCLQYYPCTPINTYAEVECGDEYIVKDDKVVCKELRIVKTLTYNEFRELATGTITTPLLQCSYVKGILNGSYKEWYLNEKIKLETVYVDGKKHGIYRRWRDNGQLSFETYVDDKEHGIHRDWYSNGQLSLETTYVNNKICGSFKNWYSNGQLSLEKNV